MLTTILRLPASMAVKRVLRNISWSLQGDQPVNPPIPATVRSMLFVCLGNICRSPFAGVLAAQRLARSGAAGIDAQSAGIRTTQAKRSPREACEAAAPYGVSLEDHVPQTLTKELMNAFDMVIVMERAQLLQLRSQYPGHRDKIFLLSLWDDQAAGAYERFNIADPFGQQGEAFDSCYSRIERALDRLIPALGRT